MRLIILIFIGLSSGFFVAGGIFAFVTMIGVIQRMAAGSKTAKYVRVYENIVIISCTLANIISLYQIVVPLGLGFLGIYGIFAGIYVGCIAFALAEILNVLPVFTKRVHLKAGLPYSVTAFAIGKMLGALYQFVISK